MSTWWLFVLLVGCCGLVGWLLDELFARACNHTTIMQLSLESVSTVLQQVGFVEYLCTFSIIQLTTASSFTFSLVRPHIITHWSYTRREYGSLKVYPLNQIRKVILNCRALQEERYMETLFLNHLPCNITSLTMNVSLFDSDYNFPQHITNLKIYTNQYAHLLDYFPPKLIRLEIHAILWSFQSNPTKAI